MKRRNSLLVLVIAVLLFAPVVHAKSYNADARDEPQNMTTSKPKPAQLEALQELTKTDPILGGKRRSRDSTPPNSSEKRKANGKRDNLAGVADNGRDEQDLALKIRRDSMREAALSFGARGGLAWRTMQIMDELSQNEAGLDKSYNFRRLLIKAPSNMFIEPPIVSEALNSFIVTNNGSEAAVADTIYHISRQARIVSAPRNWRQYLERDWKEVLPPPDILLPENAAERESWRIWVAEGWDEGYKQADEIFQADLNRMVADFEGMVRYRVLLAQNKISAPYATLEDRGVSGKDVTAIVGDREVKITNEMRVGDRAIRITAPATLRADREGEQWDAPIRSPQ